jgi:hypothetical protein
LKSEILLRISLALESVMARLPTGVLIICVVLVCLALADSAHAFGAGNIASIAKIEGTNWRHG